MNEKIYEINDKGKSVNTCCKSSNFAGYSICHFYEVEGTGDINMYGDGDATFVLAFIRCYNNFKYYGEAQEAKTFCNGNISNTGSISTTMHHGFVA